MPESGPARAAFASFLSMREPLATNVVLYVPEGRDGVRSQAVLEKAHVKFVAVPAPNAKRPIAEFGGVIFEGLSGIIDLSQALVALRELLGNGREITTSKGDH